MKQECHEKISVQKFGAPFSEVHAFLDQYFGQFGEYHRYLLHHRKGIGLAEAEFTGPVRKVAEQHILDDMGKVPEDWSEGFGPTLGLADYYISKNKNLPRGALIEAVKKLYPEDAHLISALRDYK